MEMGNQKITIADDRLNVIKNENGGMKSDSFMVDLESFSTNGLSKEAPINSANSRITLQRNVSRKGPQRVVEKNINDRDPLSPSPSPKAVQVVSMSEKSLSPPTPSDNDHHTLPQHIIIKTGVVSPLADQGKWGKRSSSFKRSPHTLFSNPKRILLFFATLSSMGTILLIYFTLSMTQRNVKEFHF